MPKKHKPKGGNQQKPRQPKSFQNDRSHNGSGPHTPFFTLRDEVVNTERHHSEWSPSVKLRHKAIAFVSAGSIQPSKEPQASRPAEVDKDLDKSHGALAQLHITSPLLETSEATGSVSLAPFSVPIEQKRLESPPLKTPVDLTDDSSQLFVVDSVGDASLKPKDVTPPVINTPQYSAESEDEVIVFRGRRDRVIVRDEGVSGPGALGVASRSPAGRSTAAAELEVPADPLEASLLVAGLNPLSASKVAKAFQEPAEQTRDQGEEDVIAVESKVNGKKKRKNKKTRRSKQGKAGGGDVFRSLQDDGMSDGELEDELFRDYIANMDSDDAPLVAIATHGGDSDEWLSSEMDETDANEPTIVVDVADDGNGKTGPTSDIDMTDGSAFVSNLEGDEDDDQEADEEDEDEEEEDDGDGNSDIGDSSELESDLEYDLREQFEDEEDLRQRQIDALTDEEIARILAKQEDLGMGGDEILLLDDSGFGDLGRAQAGLDAILADPLHPQRPRARRKRRSDHFPSATLMADVLDEDPYNGFDIMDFDRPSLRTNTKGKKGRKSAGPLPEELLNLSDSDVLDDLQSSWANDRAKKAAKKAEREELRAAGLLGKKNKFKPDLGARFAQGMTLDDVRDELEEFLGNEHNATKAFPPMEKAERKLLHEIAMIFDLTSNSRGSGKNRFTILSKRARTPTEVEQWRWNRVQIVASRGFLKAAGKGKSGLGPVQRAGRGGGFSKAAVGYANGEEVGAAAPEISASSFGRKMLEKMGWERGMALGKEGGGDEGRLLVPVTARIKSGRGGLG